MCRAGDKLWACNYKQMLNLALKSHVYGKYLMLTATVGNLSADWNIALMMTRQQKIDLGIAQAAGNY